MSKSSTPNKFMPACWIVAVAALAVVGIVAAGSANPSQPRRTSVAAASAKRNPGNRTVAPAAQDRIHARYAALPLAFEANEDQADPQIQYVARGKGYKLSLKSKQAIMTLLPSRKGKSEVRDMMMHKRLGPTEASAMLKKPVLKPRHRTPYTASVEMNFLGANPGAQLVADDIQRGKVNYFIGRDPSKWHSNVPLYGRVSYRNIYPGIDLAFHGAGKMLEFDYLVSPGANAACIALNFQGADTLRTDSDGDLVLATSSGSIQVNKPVAYQSINGAREIVDARFVVSAKNEVTFALGSYDHNRDLVIDPTFVYSTYFGGDGADYASGITVDASGNAYVTGATDSTMIPGNSAGAIGFDSFVTKIDLNGALLFTSIFGGSNDEFPGGIVVDSTGIYIAGTTDSSDFPVTGAAAQTVFEGGIVGGGNDAFAVKLSPDGTILTWGTYIAGTSSDSGLGIAVDSGRNVYVVGETFSTNIGGGVVAPLPGGDLLNLNQNTTNDDGYIVKLNSTGSVYTLVSYLGGSGGDLASSIALDASGNIYVSGETLSNDLPTTASAVQPACGTDGNCNPGAQGARADAFVAKIASNLSYNYLTYYGGSDVDVAFAITADASGNAYVTGTTASTDLLYTTNTFQTSLLGAQNAFLLELNSTGTAVNYDTYFGGDGSDFGLGVVLAPSFDNSAYDVYLTGQSTSSSSSFPLLNATQAFGDGNSDAFVSVLSLSQGLLFSTFLGGGGDDDQFQGSIALDPSNFIYVSGDTNSGNGGTDVFPTVAALDSTYGGGTCIDNVGNSVPCTDAFVAEYGPANAADFGLSATPLSPGSVNAGGSATSTITVSNLNGYGGTVNLACSVTGSGAPLPACSLTSTTLTVTTTGAAAAMNRGASGIYYAIWLPVVGLSLVGMRFTSPGSRKKRRLGFLLLGLVMAALFFLPACGGGSNNGGGGGGGCAGCTPAGNYTITVTGTDSVDASLSHAVDLTLTVN